MATGDIQHPTGSEIEIDEAWQGIAGGSPDGPIATKKCECGRVVEYNAAENNFKCECGATHPAWQPTQMEAGA